QVKVFSPTPANREKFARHFQNSLGATVTPAATPGEAVAGADVVICAARAKNESPVLHAQWLEPGMTLVSIGSTLPEQREVAADVIGRANLIVADMPDEVARDTGDMIAASKAGFDFTEKLIHLTEVVSGKRAPRASENDIVLYKSVGSALQDVVIAEMLLKRALARGLGTRLPVNIAPVAK
ncbi:MAG TPA: hypothetical protein VHB68_20955, partial [Steroidobacteraceae bacterium]|nr:hypothetical protein [Steroidobacteraceae bacterium]